MSTDPRMAIYSDLHHGQLNQQEEQNRQSGIRLLSMLREYIEFRSVLDVGCGLGTWLNAAQSLGIADVFGVEGPWFDPKAAVIDPGRVLVGDLEQPFSLQRRFDLVVCLEVAEHLNAPAAPNLIRSLVSHGDCVLFSAAIPFQGGHHHVNEQFADYWAALFAQHDYHPLDLFRPRIWKDPAIMWWLRQNLLLYARRDVIQANPKLAAEHGVRGPLSVVHPDVYLFRMQHAQQAAIEHQQLMGLLNQGGQFTVARLPDGRMNITRTA